jgi:hypothetical protein
MKIEYEDIIKMILQFLYENKLLQTFKTLKQESNFEENFIPSKRAFKVRTKTKKVHLTI